MSFAAILAVLKSPITWCVAAALAAVIFMAVVYHKGEKAGTATVESAVEHKAITETEKARKQEEQAHEKVQSAPDGSVIDSTR